MLLHPSIQWNSTLSDPSPAEYLHNLHTEDESPSGTDSHHAKPFPSVVLFSCKSLLLKIQSTSKYFSLSSRLFLHAVKIPGY